MLSTGFFLNLTATSIVFALDGITFLYKLKLMIATFSLGSCLLTVIDVFCAKLLFCCTQLRFGQLSNKAYD